MQNLTVSLTSLRTRMDGVTQNLDFEREQMKKLDARLAEIEVEKTALVKAVCLLDKTIEVVSSNGIGRIESTVTNGLRLVFDDPTLAMKVVKNEGKRGNSYEIVGVRGDVEGPFLETFGGGVANIVSFLLRVLILKRFKMARVLVLDELFGNVSANRQPMVSKLLHSLAKDGGYTILAVTHSHPLALSADRVYVARMKNGQPVLEEINPSMVMDMSFEDVTDPTENDPDQDLTLEADM